MNLAENSSIWESVAERFHNRLRRKYYASLKDRAFTEVYCTLIGRVLEGNRSAQLLVLKTDL